jgi:hypothetical protein
VSLENMEAWKSTQDGRAEVIFLIDFYSRRKWNYLTALEFVVRKLNGSLSNKCPRFCCSDRGRPRKKGTHGKG